LKATELLDVRNCFENPCKHFKGKDKLFGVGLAGAPALVQHDVQQREDDEDGEEAWGGEGLEHAHDVNDQAATMMGRMLQSRAADGEEDAVNPDPITLSVEQLFKDVCQLLSSVNALPIECMNALKAGEASIGSKVPLYDFTHLAGMMADGDKGGIHKGC